MRKVVVPEDVMHDITLRMVTRVDGCSHAVIDADAQAPAGDKWFCAMHPAEEQRFCGAKVGRTAARHGLGTRKRVQNLGGWIPVRLPVCELVLQGCGRAFTDAT